MNAFRLSERDLSPGCHEVRVEGELDLAVREQLRAALAEAESGGGQDVLVDLTDCDFVDGSGLEILVWTRLQLRRRGREMVIRGARDQVERLLRTAGMAEPA
jgi:anti-anti-sigma factor